MSNGESSVTDDRTTSAESNQESTNADGQRSSTRSDDETCDRVRFGKVPKPDDQRKLFVGQLSADITKEDLVKYFSTFGSIEDVTMKYDGPGGRARGFAFILFDDKDSIDKVLNVPKHVIKQCQIDPKQAHRRPPVTNPVKKIFIGQLPTDFVEEHLSTYFSQFGIVDAVELPMDRNKSARRSFGFVSFSSEKTAEEVLRQQRHSINGISIEVRPAKPRPHEQQQYHYQAQQHSIHGNRYQQQAQQQQSLNDYQSYSAGRSSVDDYLVPQHATTFMSNVGLTTVPGQTMINLPSNINPFYTSAVNNHPFGAQMIDQYGQLTNQSLSFWTNPPTDSRNNNHPNGNTQWSTGTNGNLATITNNSHFYNSVSNGTAPPTIYQGNVQASIFNPTSLSHQIGYPSNSYSNSVAPTYHVASSSQTMGNVYPAGYASSSMTTGSSDQPTNSPSSTTTTSWNPYNPVTQVLNGTASNFDHSNIYYSPPFYSNIYPSQFYQTGQQQTTMINQSQSALANDQSASSNGAHEKSFQNHSR